MASRGSISIQIIVNGWPPNAPNLTYQESMILSVEAGDDTDLYFRQVTAALRNTLPGPAALVGAQGLEFDPQHNAWAGTIGTPSATIPGDGATADPAV